MSRLKLYRYEVEVGRMGDLYGIFIASDEQVNACLGKGSYFGEVLGKHSEVEVVFAKEDITLISEDSEDVSRVLKIFGEYDNDNVLTGHPIVLSGYCPLSAILDKIERGYVWNEGEGEWDWEGEE